MLRKFWWGSRNGERKVAWVSWEVMTMPKYMGGLGFRDTQLFNLAMLAKQSWRIMQDPNSLSASLLKAVYFPECDLLVAEVGSHPSQVWRAICEGTMVLKQGLIRKIGNRQTTRIWEQSWIPRDHMLRALHPRSGNPPELVADLMNEAEKSWNREQVLQHMQAPDAFPVLRIPLSSRNIPDTWAWHYERSGNFSVRSAYRLLVDTKRRREDWLEGRPGTSNTDGTKKQWCRLWKSSVPSKLKNFAWRLARNSIPTEAVRCARKMMDSSQCAICNCAEDTWRHALVDCNMAKAVWCLVDEDLVDHLIVVNNPNARIWLMDLQESMGQDDFAKVLVTLWAI
jgi:hypothetical protein